jgi:hypothetical protein
MVRMKHVTPAETLANLQSLLLMTISGTACRYLLVTHKVMHLDHAVFRIRFCQF